MTGGVSTEIYTSSILDKEVFWSQELMKANKEALFSCFTGIFGGWGQRKGIQEMHEYSVLRAVETHGERLLLLRCVPSELCVEADTRADWACL